MKSSHFISSVLIMAMVSATPAAAVPVSCAELFDQQAPMASHLSRARYDLLVDQFQQNGVSLGDPSITTAEELLAATDVLNVNAANAISKAPGPSLGAKAFDQLGDPAFAKALLNWHRDWMQSPPSMRSNEVDRKIDRLLKILTRRTLLIRAQDWVGQWGPSRIKQTWNQLPEGIFLQGLQLKLLKHGLKRVLLAQGQLDNPISRSSFDRWMARNRGRLRFLLASALAVSGLMYGMVPVYLPVSDRINHELENPKMLDSILDNGFDGAMPNISSESKKDARSLNRYNLLARAYTIIAVTVTLAFLPHMVHEQTDRLMTQYFLSSVEQMAKPLDANSEGDKLFFAYVEKLRVAGDAVDLNSPELKDLRAKWRATFASAINDAENSP